jgi:hypothetical protein
VWCSGSVSAGTTVDIIRVSSSIFQEAASADGVIDSETTSPRAMRSFCNTGIVTVLPGIAVTVSSTATGGCGSPGR